MNSDMNGYENLKRLSTEPCSRGVFVGGFSEDGEFVAPFMDAISAIHEDVEFVQLGKAMTRPRKLRNIFDKPTTLYGHSGFWIGARRLVGLPKQIIADDPLEPTKAWDMVMRANALDDKGTVLEPAVPEPKKSNGAKAVIRRPRQLDILRQGRKISTGMELVHLASTGDIDALMITYRSQGEFEFGYTAEARSVVDDIKVERDISFDCTAGFVDGTHNAMLLQPQRTLRNIGFVMGWRQD